MSEQTVFVRRNGAVAAIHLNRPTELNAIDQEMADGIVMALDQLEREPDVRVIVLRGEGRSFCVGGDHTAASGQAPGEAVRWLQRLVEIHVRIQQFPKPLIARIHGQALGLGCSLSASCDFAIAAEEVQMGFPDVEHGMVPGVSMVFLRPLVSSRLFRELMLTGRRFNGREAQSFGLVNQVVQAPALDEAVDALAGRLAELSPTALRLTKRLAHDLADMTPSDQLRAAQDVVMIARSTPDAIAGASRLRAGRQPG